MISKLTGTDKFLDLIGSMQFWLTMAIVVGIIVVIVICIKNPKIGGPLLGTVFSLIILALDVYSIIQLNYYYNAEGGIHGKLTGIFKTNEVEVVDNLTFEVKNIELTETTEGVYSASITTNKVLSLETKESLGVFINGMPCDTTSEINSDYAIANYVYTFYDNNKTAICTDTLTLNFAFYENSTYLSLSTKGGTLPVKDCVEYWHHYFNKNGFEVKIAPFNKVSDDVIFTNGDTSKYATVSYVIDDDVVCQQVYTKSEELRLPVINDKHTDWMFNETAIENGYIVTEDMTITASYIYSYNITLRVQGETYLTETIHSSNISIELPTYIYSDDTRSEHRFVIQGWSVDGENIIDTSTYVVNNDLTLHAIGYIEYLVTFNIADTVSKQWVKEGTYAESPEIPSYFAFEGWTTRSSSTELIDLSTYTINESITFNAKGTYLQTVNFYANEELYSTSYVNYGDTLIFPETDPTLEGYTFVGWSLDGIVKIDTLTVKDNLNVYALFASEYEMLVTISSSVAPCTMVDGETNISAGEVAKTCLVSKEIRIVCVTSIKSVNYVVETDGEYVITTNALGDDTITFTNSTYAKIVVNYTLPPGMGYM